MNDDIKKLFWTGVAVIIVILFMASVIEPTFTQVEGLKTQITDIDYTNKP